MNMPSSNITKGLLLLPVLLEFSTAQVKTDFGGKYDIYNLYLHILYIVK